MDPSIVTCVNDEGVVAYVGFVEMFNELPASFVEPITHGVIFCDGDWPPVD